ncbi:MAG TPA: YdbH domain-containing protein [Sphingomicrobium sp.]|nr:YdbH domain-containing protein [Sphingomicrobium sp.]
MDERRIDEELDLPEPVDGAAAPRRAPWWARLASVVAVGILVLLLSGIIIVWFRRLPIATHYLKGEFERRGVTASYHLDRVGLRNQEVSNLVIGDPKRPDLVARYAHIETRLTWNGNFEVYRIIARGVRLRGRLVHGRISWGEIDKLLPPPTNKPFALPNFVLDVADSSIALSTPFGPLGISLQGNGRLSGGFVGHAAVVSPKLVPGRCAATDLHAFVAVGVTARRPDVSGPVTLARFACAASRFSIEAPSFDAKASFNEAFTNVDGGGRMAIATLIAGSNGLADFIGNISFKGKLDHVTGHVNLMAQRSRLATITAQGTHLDGNYNLDGTAGKFQLVGDYGANNAALAPSMIAGITGPLSAIAKTPIAPVAQGIGNAIVRTAAQFNSSGRIKVVNFPGGGAARITQAMIAGPNGAQARVFGGSGVTYYWPKGGLRVDANLQMGGGGLPQANVSLHQPFANAPLSGVATMLPYSANGQRLALDPIRFAQGTGGSTAVSTVAQLDGSFAKGRVQALRLPITGEIGSGGGFAFGTTCAVVSVNYLQTGALQLGPTRLPVCPINRAIISKLPGRPVQTSGRINRPVLNGRLGSSPFHVQASSGELIGQQFAFDRLSAELGRSASLIKIEAARLSGRFSGAFGGNFSGASAMIGKVPVLLSDATGSWVYRNRGLRVDSSATVVDRSPNPRFYPLHSNNIHFRLAGDLISATGSLRHPATGTLVTNVSIEHHLAEGSGRAILDVPGIAFGPNFQPEALTRLTEGVVALVNGTVQGQGRIEWAAGGKMTSTGDFSTSNMGLAAPFGPVTGLTTHVHFDDLLARTTPPGQIVTVGTINPGILVSDGVIRYQLLPHDHVKIESGQWPFMGGRLILHETVLDFSQHSAKRLNFELQGFDAKQFVDSLGFKGFELSGIFDGVLPMVFDENGGRIVGGVLRSRAPGGELKYTGTKPKGMAAGLAVDLLSDVRFRSMVIHLDGELSGEFATRVAIDQVSLGPGHGFVAGLVHRAFSKLPLKLNLNINGPFRALIQMSHSFNDPTQVIAPVMPFPIDSPALKVDVISSSKSSEQSTTPSKQQTLSSQSRPSGGKK